MRLVTEVARVAAVLGVIAVYSASVYVGITEEKRWTLNTEQPSTTGGSVVLNVSITSIDTKSGLVTERIRLVPMGEFATDKSTPSRDLKLLLNSVSGQQTVTFPKGARISPIDATTILSGNQNKYPFDAYVTDIDFLVTTPSVRPVQNIPFTDMGPGILLPGNRSLIIGASDLNDSQTVPISQNIAASLPQFKLQGTVRQTDDNLTHTYISVRRANYVMGVSVAVMVMMILLAISIMGMVLRVTASPGEINLLPLSLCVTLIFGLPALRNIQPDVPAVGVLGDSVSFIWAEFIVTTSAIALAWTWIIRSRKQDHEKLLLETDAQHKPI